MSDAAKHTPGPWYATTRKGSWDWVVARGRLYEICQIFHDGTEFDETGEANARLIAAAPEMLSELRKCLGILGWVRNTTSEPRIRKITDEAIQRMQSAIAKAKGK